MQATPSLSLAPTELGFVHFLTQADAVGLALFAVLVAMSVLSWTVIVGRVRRATVARRRNRAFLAELDQAKDDQALARSVQAHAGRAPLARFALAALAVRTRLVPAPDALALGPTTLQQSLQQKLDEEAALLESGQTTLASIASSAPFVGLFGTVWGIYHALLQVAASGQSSLDQVAGPIGEALIMTACGLAAAIPAALAYNAFQRQIRLQLAQCEKLADELQLRAFARGAS